MFVAVFAVAWFLSRKYYSKHRSELFKVSPISPNKNFQWCWETGYPGTIPRISLPSALSLLTQYQVEWWFYVGYLLDDAGIYYSVEFTVIRSGIGSKLFQLVKNGAYIGNDRIFKSSESFGYGADTEGYGALHIPPADDNTYTISFKPNIAGSDNLSVNFTNGVVGQPGAKYNLSAKGDSYMVNIDFTDIYGGRMEGANGFVGTSNPDALNSSYEFCFPWYNVDGGKIEFDGRSNNIKEGWLWLDRQVITYRDSTPVPKKEIMKNPLTAKIATSKQKFKLYTGNWIAVVLPENNCSFYIACGWPKMPQGKQWLVGTDFRRSATWSIGSIWTPFGTSPGEYNIGGEMPKFTINIKNAENYNSSPHWKSPISGITYSSAWRVDFNQQYPGLPSKSLWIEYLRPDCESDADSPIGSPYMEGAARVYTDINYTRQVGWAWVEQMGMN